MSPNKKYVASQLRKQPFNFRQRGNSMVTYHPDHVSGESAPRRFLSFNPSDFLTGGFVCRKCWITYNLGSFERHSHRERKQWCLKAKQQLNSTHKTTWHAGNDDSASADPGNESSSNSSSIDEIVSR